MGGKTVQKVKIRILYRNLRRPWAFCCVLVGMTTDVRKRKKQINYSDQRKVFRPQKREAKKSKSLNRSVQECDCVGFCTNLFL